MQFKDVLVNRRAYRALESVDISDQMVRELAEAASLAPSCSNNQPWRFVFVRKGPQMDRLLSTLTKGNYWAMKASMVAAVFTRPELDCRNDEGDYHWFDTGLATGFLLLKATDMGLVTHPIAGFDQAEARRVLDMPEGYRLLTLVIIGKRSMDVSGLSERHRGQESERPERLPMERTAFYERFSEA